MRRQISNLMAVLHDLDEGLELTFEPAVRAICDAFSSGGKVLIAGNGGSAAMADHMAAEFVVRFDVDRRALPAIALTESTILSACGNDYGYYRTISRQVEAYGKPGDVFVGYSTSGKSKNILDAFGVARQYGLIGIGISGNDGIVGGTDIDIVVRSKNTARIQEAHLLITHMLVESVLQRVPQ
jgi:D-sedoheptulose 7-phosphate isomerase